MPEVLQLIPDDVRSATLEYRASFADPIFEAWGRRNELMASFFRAFQPLAALSDLTVHDENSGNARLELEIPSQRLKVTLSLGYLGALVTKPDWSQREVLLDLANRARGVLQEHVTTSISLQWLSLYMHLLPRGQ